MREKILVTIILLLCSGCYGPGETVEWYESFRFHGVVVHKNMKDELIVLEEVDAPESRKDGNRFEIPVDDFEKYQKGDKVHVIVETNTTNDVWDLDHLRFHIKPLE
ncbi:hypothetical protein [Halobacillus litoralis]|uniref:hypothetical protein n=1 Tax=Halobacillus litoralis TaxID=45668 RepID=UPI001CFCCF1A|nr:hypothetical protein [Halobacillus litoralis]